MGRWLERERYMVTGTWLLEETVLPHGAACHLDGILQTRLASGFQLVSVSDGLEHVLRVTCSQGVGHRRGVPT